MSIAILLSGVPEHVREEAILWDDRLRPLANLRTGQGEAKRQMAEKSGVPLKTLEKKLTAYRKHGIAGLINKSKAGPAFWNSAQQLAFRDAELLKTYAEKYHRSTEAAVQQMRMDWRRGLIVTETPIDPETGYPRGWSERNLARMAPTRYELAAARIGRSKAAAHRPLVYTTRANIYVGQYYLWDDMWHDHFVNDLDSRSTGRPLEFHALDLASACKIGWGMRVRREVDGVNEGLKGDDFRFLLACVLTAEGYHPDGTTLVVEHGTAAISEAIERLLYDATGGAIKVARSGMEGAPAHAGQYAGRAKGNFRFKAALESLGNLIHNQMAALPGQTGKDRDHRPEQLHGLLKHNDALLAALSQLPAERAQWLQWDLCTIQQFRLIAEEIYARINGRTNHDLEGWDARYVPDTRTGKMRRMSPTEVWRPGRRPLAPISPETAALILGTNGGVERVTRNGMIELRDAEISGDVLRFDAHSLPDREKLLTVLNPFAADKLTCFDAKGRYVATLDRLRSVDRGDVEAVHRQMGKAANIEAEMLAPLRRRHLAEAREKLARHEHNADVLSGKPMSEAEQAARIEQAERAVGADEFQSKPELTRETADFRDFEDQPKTPLASASDFM